MTTLTSDKHVSNFSDFCITTPDGLRHYAVIVDALPPHTGFDELRHMLPFYVAMCDLCDAYGAAMGWFDFKYPTPRYAESCVERNFPTCARCSGA